MTPSRVVEFVGIPGAGKSTIASALYQHLASRCAATLPLREEFRRRKLTRAEKLTIDVRFGLKLLRYRLARIAHTIRIRGARPSSLSFGWERSRYPALLLDHINKNPAELFILDEWLVHSTIDEALRRWPRDLTFGSRFGVSSIRGLSVLYVFVEIELQTALARIAAQHQPGRTFLKRHKEQEALSSVLQAWQHQVENVKTTLAQTGAPIISIDGTHDVAVNVESLCRWLTTELSTGPTNQLRAPFTSECDE